MEWIAVVVVAIVAVGCLVLLARSRQSETNLRQENAGLREERARQQGQMEQLEADKEAINAEFKVMASQVMESNSQNFLQLANENMGKNIASAKGEFDRQHLRFQELVKPLSESYTKLDPTIKSLMEQNTRIAQEASNLSNALKDNRRVGAWGEIQLRRVVETAGMSAYCDFTEQATLESGDRPDLLVKLPEKRTILVDSKASTSAYREAYESGDDDEFNVLMAKHAAGLKTQVDDLAKKRYGDQEPGSLDFVVMFVPGDQFLSAALNANPDLVEYAIHRRVALATPASLIAMLWAVEHGWQQYRLAEQANDIKDAGETLHTRLQKFIGDYQKVGSGLASAVKSFNDSIGAYDLRVAPQGRRFAQLLKGSEDSLPAPHELDLSVATSRYAPALPDGAPATDDQLEDKAAEG